jgi:hypothetical protein
MQVFLSIIYMKYDVLLRAVFEWHTDAPEFQLQRPAPPLRYQWLPGPHLTAVYCRGGFDLAYSLPDKLSRIYAQLRLCLCPMTLLLISSKC